MATDFLVATFKTESNRITEISEEKNHLKPRVLNSLIQKAGIQKIFSRNISPMYLPKVTKGH